MAPNTDFRLKTGYVKALVVFRTNLAFISTTNGAQLQHRPSICKIFTSYVLAAKSPKNICQI